MLNNIKTILTMEDLPFDNGLIMNAHRPLHGDATTIGPSIYGRHYAKVLPGTELGEKNIQTNVRLDARILIHVTKEQAIQIGLSQVPERYRDNAKIKLETDRANCEEWLLSRIPQHLEYQDAIRLLESL